MSEKTSVSSGIPWEIIAKDGLVWVASSRGRVDCDSLLDAERTADALKALDRGEVLRPLAPAEASPDVLLHAPDCPRNAPNEGMCSCWPERDRRLARMLPEKIAALTAEQIVELTEGFTDRDGCFYGGFHEWREALVAALRIRGAGEGDL